MARSRDTTTLPTPFVCNHNYRGMNVKGLRIDAAPSRETTGRCRVPAAPDRPFVFGGATTIRAHSRADAGSTAASEDAASKGPFLAGATVCQSGIALPKRYPDAASRAASH